jgi:hypothetical protein
MDQLRGLVRFAHRVFGPAKGVLYSWSVQKQVAWTVFLDFLVVVGVVRHTSSV